MTFRRAARRPQAARVTSRLAALGPLAIAASMVLAPSGAQAETASPAGLATLQSLGLTSPVRDLAVAGGKLWVSTGNEVDVFSTAGKKLTTITGLLGANELVTSADGTAVYVGVEQDARIATLGATTMTETASWPAGPCPTHLARAAGRLFYAFGCDTLDGAISSINLADGSAGPVVVESLYYPPRLSGAADTLVAIVPGISPATADSYTANADGTLTHQATASLSTNDDFAVSADGRQVITTGGYQQLNRYSTADLSVAGTFTTTAWNRAVAYSADGTAFAGSTGLGRDDLVRVFDNTAATLTSRSTGAVDASVGALPTVLTGTLQFSPDGTLLYGLTQENGQVARLLTATAQSVARGQVTTTVTSPKAYGQKVTVKVATGRAKTSVTLKITTSSTGAVTTVTRTSDAKGTVTIPLAAKFNGTLTATANGDLRHATATSSARAFRVPAAITLKVTGAYSSRGGMLHFHKISKVKVPITVRPDRVITGTFTLQARLKGKWTTINTSAFTADSDGSSYFYLASGRKKVPYRFVVKFAGDTYNAKAPVATSKVFIAD